MTLKKITFQHVNGVVWLDGDTFKALVNFYLSNHPLEADKIEIEGYEMEGFGGSV